MREHNQERCVGLLSEAGIGLNDAWDISGSLSHAFNAKTSEELIVQLIKREWSAWDMYGLSINRTWKKSAEPKNAFDQEDELLKMGCEKELAHKFLSNLYGSLTPADFMEKVHLLRSFDLDPRRVVTGRGSALSADGSELRRRLSLGLSLGLDEDDILDTFKTGSLKRIVRHLEKVKRRRISVYSKIRTYKRKITALKNEAASCKKKVKTLQSLIDLAGDDNATENADGQT